MRKGLLRSLNRIQPLRNGTHELLDLESLCGNRGGVQSRSITHQTHGTQQQRLTRSPTCWIPTQTVHFEERVNLGTSLSRMFLNTIPEEPHQIARLLVIDKLVGTWMAHEAFLGLLLGLPSQRNDPRYPLQSTREIANLGTQSLTQLIGSHRQSLGVLLLENFTTLQRRRSPQVLMKRRRMKVVFCLDRRQIGKLIFATQSHGSRSLTNHATDIRMIANRHNVLNRELTFQRHVLFKLLRQLSQDVGLSPIHMLSRCNKQRIPHRVNQSRTQEFQTPVTRLVRVTFLDVFGQDFADMGSWMSRKGCLLKIPNGTGIADLHYF